MSDKTHEVRDPIHVFVRLDSAERRVLNSEPYQRLRDVHQLAMTYLVYPGATHRRFEHCLGVMELAGRIFDVVTDPEHLYDDAIRSAPLVCMHEQGDRSTPRAPPKLQQPGDRDGWLEQWPGDAGGIPSGVRD